MASIIPFVRKSGAAFDNIVAALLGEAFDAVCRELHNKGQPAILNENVRDRVRALANTEAFQQSLRERKKVEMRFAHMKRIFRLDRLRLRGLNGPG